MNWGYYFRISGRFGKSDGARRYALALRAVGVLFLMPFLAACGTAARVVDAGTDTASRAVNVIGGSYGRADADLGGTPVFYTNPRIVKADMQVMVHPNVNLEEVPTALFLPFGITQSIDEAVAISQGVSTQLWQQMLQAKAFSVLELARMKPPYRVEYGLPLAKRMGADMLVGGYITYFYPGGKNSDSKLSIQMEVYEVATGNMLWSVAHAATLPYKPNRDFLIGEVSTRMPEDAMASLIQAIGADFAELLHRWTEPAAYPPEGSKRYFDSAFGSF